MCGINAIYDPNQRLPEKADLIGAMNDAMRYRGPDDEGRYVDQTIALGMRRLSIIDVAGGHQPIFNEDGSLVIVFNGEIYNYVELMERLKRSGHRFGTSSDTEVILHLYEEMGEGCLAELRGMFAFVIWDLRRRRLFAARDHIGIKPLYVAQVDGRLFLSSELKTIVSAAGITPTLRPEAVYQFLLYGYAIDPRHTIINEVTRILPGEYLVADEAGVSLTRYWAPRFGGETGIVDRSDTEILEILQTAVHQHLRSDVPVGILLSGGIDSSAVAALAARSGTNYVALCAGYTGRHPDDERDVAHATAAALGIPHVDVVLDVNSYETAFDDLIGYIDEPMGDTAAMPQWSLYRRARELGYKVLLSGIGGDEIFFGYPMWNPIGEQSRSLDAHAYQHWIGFNEEPFHRQMAMQVKLLHARELQEVSARANAPLYALRDEASPGPDAMASMLLGSYMVHNGCLLVDKLSMGCSVELRVPLLDHQLVEAVLALPLHRRFESGESKPLLRRVLRGLVPDAVLDAKKRGFSSPMRYFDQLVTRRVDAVLDGVLVRKGWIDRTALARLIEQQIALPWLHSFRLRRMLNVPRSTTMLFRLLAFERWYEVVMHGPKVKRELLAA